LDLVGDLKVRGINMVFGSLVNIIAGFYIGCTGTVVDVVDVNISYIVSMECAINESEILLRTTKIMMHNMKLKPVTVKKP